MPRRRAAASAGWAWGCALGLALLLAPSWAAGQDLGHRVLGTLGLDAGKQADAGLYVADQFGYYRATLLRDAQGNVRAMPGFDLEAFAAALGIATTFQIGATFLTAVVSLPAARIWATADEPQVTLDATGLADARIQPLGVGWRWTHLDVVGSYALYLPTGRFEPNEGSLSRGGFVHELSAGGTVFFDRGRQFYFSVLGSYDISQKKISVDLTRGDMLQFQGGLGLRLLKVLDVGAAGYALWQVTDDTGSAVPPSLEGARDRAFGAGPEVGLAIPSLRVKLTARYEADFGVHTRPQGQIAILGITFAAVRDGAFQCGTRQ